MKTTNKEQTAFREMQTQFWRAELQKCNTPEQALATLKKDAGLDRGRAIMQMRAFRPDLYNAWRGKPSPFKPANNPHMQKFHFIGR
jgi:hypothetical protein